MKFEEIMFCIVWNKFQNSILRDAKRHNQKYMWELAYSEKNAKDIVEVKWVNDQGRIRKHMSTSFRYVL